MKEVLHGCADRGGVRRIAFTWIELLVVIAIIGLLVSILHRFDEGERSS